MAELEIKTAKVFHPLLQPARYLAAFGGRGSGKSRFFGGLMIERHYAEPGLRSVCIREVQKSLKDSAKRLLEDRIEEYGLGKHFLVQHDCIKTPGKGIIVFQGMSDQTAESIKSLEAFDIAWVEEAQTLSTRSLELLRPTIRAPNSQLWFSWNPRRKSDPVDAMFRGEEKPSNAIVVQSNWDSNPWFNETTLEQERLDCLRMSPDQYNHIWQGGYITVSTGAYFAKHITDAKNENRIGLAVAKDKIQPFRAFIDIGGTGARSDAFSMWIAQFVGKEIRIVDYYEAIGQEFPDHVRWLNANGYGDAEIILPHDGINHDRLQRVTYQSAFRDAGFKRVIVVENQGVGAATARIEAVRRIFPQCWFDVKTEAGTDALGWYHPRIDEKRQYDQGPEHDWSSHAADAFGLLAIYYETEFKPRQVKRTTLDYTHIDRGIV
jgi:phage terminase large subunit